MILVEVQSFRSHCIDVEAMPRAEGMAAAEVRVERRDGGEHTAADRAKEVSGGHGAHDSTPWTIRDVYSAGSLGA